MTQLVFSLVACPFPRALKLAALVVLLSTDGLGRERSRIKHAAHYDTSHDSTDMPSTSVNESTKIPP
jgi:hypothetical protein